VARSSVFLLLGERVAIIDAGWRSSGPSILRYLARQGRSPQDVSHIVATHYHPDHVGAMAYLRARCPALVAAHEAEAPSLQGEIPLPNPFQNPALGFVTTPIIASSRPPPVGVDLRLKDGDSLDVLGKMEIIHTPGHTPGSISLYFPTQGLLIVGDALVYRHRVLELPSIHFTVDMAQARESVRRLAQLDFETLCFSHFPPIQNGASQALRRFAETLH
jgi:glyoxylase-like metal-dependent hydrolase (beta-lactamase superfamily II)